MDVSLRNSLSASAAKDDGELSPFHRSVSCWCLVFLYCLDVARGFRYWHATANSSFDTALLEGVGLAALVQLVRYRQAQRSLLTLSSSTALQDLKRMSRISTALTGLVLLCLLFHFLG